MRVRFSPGILDALENDEPAPRLATTGAAANRRRNRLCGATIEAWRAGDGKEADFVDEGPSAMIGQIALSPRKKSAALHEWRAAEDLSSN